MKKNKKKSKIKLSKFTYFVIGLDFLVAVALVIIYTPIVSFKNFWIPTAMTTMSHRYLAYTLYSEKSVDDVMSANYIVGVNEKVNLNDIVIDTNGSKNTIHLNMNKKCLIKIQIMTFIRLSEFRKKTLKDI